MLKNVSVRGVIKILKVLEFLGGKLWSCSTRFLSYDLTALGFPVMTFLNGGIEMESVKLESETELTSSSYTIT